MKFVLDTSAYSGFNRGDVRRIYLGLRGSGTPIGTNDMWIAATAMEHNCELVTLDADFGRVSELMVARL
jgi:predicted nucleic acid-binding protein